MCDFASERSATRPPCPKTMCRKCGRSVRSTSFSGLLPCRPKGVSVCSVVKAPHHRPPTSQPTPAFYHGIHGNRLRRTRKEVGEGDVPAFQPRFRHDAVKRSRGSATLPVFQVVHAKSVRTPRAEAARVLRAPSHPSFRSEVSQSFYSIFGNEISMRKKFHVQYKPYNS